MQEYEIDNIMSYKHIEKDKYKSLFSYINKKNSKESLEVQLIEKALWLKY